MILRPEVPVLQRGLVAGADDADLQIVPDMAKPDLVAADAGSIDLELDNELEDARWFPKDLVLKTL